MESLGQPGHDMLFPIKTSAPRHRPMEQEGPPNPYKRDVATKLQPLREIRRQGYRPFSDPLFSRNALERDAGIKQEARKIMNYHVDGIQNVYNGPALFAKENTI